MVVLETERLRLEPMDDRHFAGLYAMNSDPEVMRYITGRPDTEHDTRQMIERVKGFWRLWGYSWWTLVDRIGGAMIGAATLQHLDRDSTKPHEIGWRLLRRNWGRGYATEAARAIVAHAFGTLTVPRVTAVADPDNAASIAVMLRLGMRRVGPARHYGHACMLYELTLDDYRARLPASMPA